MDKIISWGIIFFCIFLFVIHCFCTDRIVLSDELTLYNPVYMYLHYGKLTYPVHHFWDIPVIVHPPFHYQTIAYLVKLGIGFFYAETLPVFFFMLLSLYLLFRSHFSLIIKIGFTFALLSTIMMDEVSLIKSIRADYTLCLVWLAGLLALESGRLDNWNPKRLFFRQLSNYLCLRDYTILL